jgi:hypothetical protein
MLADLNPNKWSNFSSKLISHAVMAIFSIHCCKDYYLAKKVQLSCNTSLQNNAIQFESTGCCINKILFALGKRQE